LQVRSRSSDWVPRTYHAQKLNKFKNSATLGASTK
jgi:hypothetical protein